MYMTIINIICDQSEVNNKFKCIYKTNSSIFSSYII